MTAFVYIPFLKRVADGLVDWGSIDIRAIPVMTNTTVDTETTAATLSDFTAIDEYDGGGYTQHDIAGLTTVEDDANSRAEVHATDGTFGSTVSGGTRNIQGILYKEYVDGTDANDRPIAYSDTGGFPKNPSGGAFDQAFDTEGAFQIKSA